MLIQPDETSCIVTRSEPSSRSSSICATPRSTRQEFDVFPDHDNFPWVFTSAPPVFVCASVFSEPNARAPSLATAQRLSPETLSSARACSDPFAVTYAQLSVAAQRLVYWRWLDELFARPSAQDWDFMRLLPDQKDPAFLIPRIPCYEQTETPPRYTLNYSCFLSGHTLASSEQQSRISKFPRDVLCEKRVIAVCDGGAMLNSIWIKGPKSCGEFALSVLRVENQMPFSLVLPPRSEIRLLTSVSPFTLRVKYPRPFRKPVCSLRPLRQLKWTPLTNVSVVRFSTEPDRIKLVSINSEITTSSLLSTTTSDDSSGIALTLDSFDLASLDSWDELCSEISLLQELLRIQKESNDLTRGDLSLRARVYWENNSETKSQDSADVLAYAAILGREKENAPVDCPVGSVESDNECDAVDSDTSSILANDDTAFDESNITQFLCSICLEKRISGCPLLLCRTCGLSCHADCYHGFEGKADQNQEWQCERCKAGHGNASCKACFVSRGFMKRTTDLQHWVHIVCAIFNPYLWFGDGPRLESVGGLSSIPRGFFGLVCEICQRKGGACVQCHDRRCRIAFHPPCAVGTGLETADLIDATGASKFVIFCDRHRRSQRSKAVVSFASFWSKCQMQPKKSVPSAKRRQKCFSQRPLSKLKREVVVEKMRALEVSHPAVCALESCDLELCAVCWFDDSVDENLIVFCDGCGLSVHQDCYGIAEVPTGQWFCEPCSSHGVQPTCTVCFRSDGGPMQKIDDAALEAASTFGADFFVKYVHTGIFTDIVNVHMFTRGAVCVQYIDALFFTDTGVNGFEKIPKKLRNKFACEVCSSHDGVCISCRFSSCRAVFHASCAREDGFPLETSVENGLLVYRAYCPRHRRVPMTLEVASRLYRRYLDVSKAFPPTQSSLSDTKGEACGNGVPIAKRKIPDASCSSRPQKTARSSGSQGDTLYCICKQPHDDREMIACDSCDEWFHSDCLTLDLALIGNLPWFCSRCQIEPESNFDRIS